MYKGASRIKENQKGMLQKPGTRNSEEPSLPLGLVVKGEETVMGPQRKLHGRSCGLPERSSQVMATQLEGARGINTTASLTSQPLISYESPPLAKPNQPQDGKGAQVI